MQNPSKYVIFKTKWGYFGLAGAGSVLCRTCLPEPASERVEGRLLENGPGAHFDKDFFKVLQEQIIAYFDGTRVDFSRDIPVDLKGLSVFSRKVLSACRDVKTGQTITYSELAKRAGRPAAGRAVGSVMARNPLPLIIPCHRVIRRDGKLGGFSAPGGINMKKRLILHEKHI